MDIRLLPFTLDLYPQALSLWKRCDGIGLSNADEPENIQAYLARNPGMSFAALEGDNLVGTILCGHDGRRGFIHHLAVEPDYRGNGIARSLLDGSLQALKDAGIQKCHLFLLNDNEEGIRFWTHVGWEKRSDICVISKFM